MAGLAIITEACYRREGSGMCRCVPCAMHLRVRPGEETCCSRRPRPAVGSSRTPTRRIRTRSPCSATASSTSTSRNARRAPPATSPTSAPWAPSTPRSTCRTAPPSEREVQRRRPEQGPRPHLLRPAQPGRLRGLAAAPQGPVLTRQAMGRRSGASQRLGCDCSDNGQGPRTRSWRSVMKLSGGCPFAGARGQSGEDGCRAPLCGMWRLRRGHRAVLVALATGSSEREPVEHAPSGGA